MLWDKDLHIGRLSLLTEGSLSYFQKLNLEVPTTAANLVTQETRLGETSAK